MGSRRRRIGFPALLVLLFLAPGGTVLSAQEGLSPRFPREDAGDWRVSVAVFESRDLPEEYLYLLRSIPGTVLNLLEGLDTHYMDDEEISARRERVLESAVEAVERELAEIREEAAELIFTAEGGAAKGSGASAELDRRAESLESELRRLAGTDPREIEVASSRDLVVERPAGGGLVEEDFPDPSVTARQKNLDMYIYGFVEEIEGIIFFETRVWNSVLRRDDRVIQKAASPESLNARMDEMLREVKEVVYGRPWAELVVEPKPENAQVYLDGLFLGTGAVASQTLEPGSHTLEVRRRGFITERRTLFLAPSERKRIPVVLELRDEEDLVIRSRPEGADAYLDAVWIGKTPLSLPRPPGVSELILKKESFVPKILMIDEDFTGEVTVGLSPAALDRETYIEKKRDAFYRSAGFFVLSFPLPFFLYTMSIDFAAGYAAAAGSGNTQEAERMRGLSEGFYHGFWGGVVISASLLAHTIYTLIDYIQAADSSR